MSSMRAGDEENAIFTPEGEEVLDELAEAMAAIYDGSPESLERLIRSLNTADVDDLARGLSASANEGAVHVWFGVTGPMELAPESRPASSSDIGVPPTCSKAAA
jgi:hypothetical protein